jgi:hypothetical protein
LIEEGALRGPLPSFIKEETMKIMILLLGLSLILAGGIGGEALSGVNFYKATFSLPQPDISTIAARAQELGFWIRVQYGLNVAYLHGTGPCDICTPENEESLFGFPQLYLDDGLFLVRLDEERYRLNIRPSPELEGTYEVFVGSIIGLERAEMEQEALRWLQQLGIVQTTSLNFTELVPQEKPELPEGLRLDSLLYALTLAPDWHDFARERGLALGGLRIKVIVELASPDMVPQGYHLIEEARSENLMRVLVPVRELIRLAHDPAVGFVRLPYVPHEAEGG